MKQVLGCIRRADERYGMIQDGDKICVGVSGGKDSLLLMYGLKLYQLFSKKKYDLCAVMLDLGLVEQDTSGIEAFAEKNGIDFEVRKTDIGDVVFNIRKEKNPCAMCAKMRRGALNDIAVSKGCNLVALGHNREDVLETFLLSLFFEARLNTFAPITYLGRSGVTVIRPLVFFPERDARAAAKRLELPVIPANCPVAGKTKREDMRLLLQEFRHIVPDVENKLMKAVVDTHKYGMWDRMKLPPRMTGGVFTGIEGDPAKILKTGGYAEDCKRCRHAHTDEE
ncbi:MAG: tRNA 2-thiocytidine biosynthesis protein TtcA [Clostridia bacterium]|nr:tRNA 2-thiocytidine biosynthesis protein TtcA [Clostridia bacterium]